MEPPDINLWSCAFHLTSSPKKLLSYLRVVTTTESRKEAKDDFTPRDIGLRDISTAGFSLR